MKKMIKIMFLSIIALILIIGGLFWSKLSDTNMKPLIHNEEIVFESLDEKIYIRAKSWGISGNHSEILLSTSSIENQHREYFRDDQYTFINSSELYYKKRGSDSLLLYVDYKSEIPKNLKTKINIIQIELKDYDEVMDYKKNYKKYQLSKISNYPVE